MTLFFQKCGYLMRGDRFWRVAKSDTAQMAKMFKVKGLKFVKGIS